MSAPKPYDDIIPNLQKLANMDYYAGLIGRSIRGGTMGYIIYKVYGETGVWTATALFLIAVAIEIQAVISSRTKLGFRR